MQPGGSHVGRLQTPKTGGFLRAGTALNVDTSTGIKLVQEVTTMLTYSSEPARMLEQIEGQASRLRDQVMTSLDGLVDLLEQRAVFRAERGDYLGQRTPQALAEVEMDVSAGVPLQESGKAIPQARRDAMVKKACLENEAWKTVNDQCKAARRDLARIDGRIEALQARVNGSNGVLGYFTGMLNYLAATETMVKF